MAVCLDGNEASIIAKYKTIPSTKDIIDLTTIPEHAIDRIHQNIETPQLKQSNMLEKIRKAYAFADKPVTRFEH